MLLYRSSILKIADFEFRVVDKNYLSRALEARDADGHLVVADENNDQESSREHAVVAPRFLGLRAVLAKSVARIHYQNLVNYGIITSLSVS
ncbi:hypothetical protein [uncultured Sulfitobacter sp.]|uniref:hypothetical protein n=1 Tax=uncultured Sulfitobacter sp. TaxID=191468 RepID=UPI00260547A0|nr:hypothetical protein [uncultured Sulfitobacter sp.]